MSIAVSLIAVGLLFTAVIVIAHRGRFSMAGLEAEKPYDIPARHLPADAPADLGPSPVLTALDRCDKRGCGRQAKVRAFYAVGFTDFCGLHWDQAADRVIGECVDVLDERGLVGA